ncbi:hypothetical protein ES703_66167 [subsurface metagenome]
MGHEPGEYRELHAFKNTINFGLLVGMPGYCKHFLLLQIIHAHWPEGKTFVGARAARKTLGISYDHWLEALYFLTENGFYKKWGYHPTPGKPALCFLLDLGVPTGRVPKPENITRQPYHSRSGKDTPLTLPLLLANLTTVLGEPYHWSKAKTDIVINNPKEPQGSFYKTLKSEKQEEPIQPYKAKEILQRILGCQDIDEDLKDRLEQFWEAAVKLKRYMAAIMTLFARRGQPGAPRASTRMECVKFLEYVKEEHVKNLKERK